MTDTQWIQKMFEECGSLNLLYVEDDKGLAQSSEELLKPFFASMKVASNGKEGLEAYQSGSYDIVITDIMMPIMDGKEMAREIRSLNPDQAIIVMSAYEDVNHFRDLIDIGISKFISKPPAFQQLMNSIVTTATEVNNRKKVAQISAELKQDLAENKELLRRIIDTVPVRIFWKDRDFRYLGCNTLFANDAGARSQEEMIGKSDFEMPWHTHAQLYVQEDAEVIESGKAKLHYDEILPLPDGDFLSLSMSKVPLRNEAGEIVGVLGAYSDITEQRKAMEALQEAKNSLGYQAEHDALTGLPNRVLFLDRLRQAIKKGVRNGKQAAIIFMDLDRFKEINDSLGHDAGDRIVQLLGERLIHVLRESDTVARFGGDEFTVLIESVSHISEIIEIMHKIMLIMDEPFEVESHHLHLTLSAGISVYPGDGIEPEVLIRNADTAMYKAKEEGRNAYHFYTQEMTERTMNHLLMAKKIREAIDNEEFVVYYQPQINGNDGKLIGMEALVRWKHPKEGMISPAEFIPIAEEAGLIDKIGEIVFKQAARQITQWYALGYTPGRVAINLSTVELQKENFVEIIQQRLNDTGCKTEWIELEITEGYTMKHPNEAISMLQQISDLGIHLSIDDFGTGYSSLSYLQRLPIHKLKIDQSFVRNIPQNKNDAAIILSIIFLAKTMRFDVIAEGVETAEQEQFLRSKGCEKIQGYLYSKPLSAEEMEEFMKVHS